MTDISIETPNGSIDAVLEIPSGDGPWPGVVVIHDAFGLREPHREIVRQIAGNGFLAVAPNLFARGGMVRCMRAVMKDLIAYEGQAFEDVAAGWELLSSRSDCTGAIGIAGFCMGAGSRSWPPRRASAHRHPSILRPCRVSTPTSSTAPVPSWPASASAIRSTGQRETP